MYDIDQILNDLNSTKTEQETEEISGEKADEFYLEQEIQGIFENRQIITRVLSSLFWISVIRSSVQTLARLGLSAIATGTVGGIAVAIAFGHALTKIGIQNGYPKIDSEFVIELLKATGVAGAIWVATDEQRQIGRQTSQGAKAFIKEVEQFEIEPTSYPIWVQPLSFLGLGLLLITGLALIFKKN